MYLDFFQLQKLPFRLRPDREFLYLGEPYLNARQRLLAALQREDPLIVLSGAAGVGKTTLLESVLEELGEGPVLIYINQPQVSPEEFAAAVREQVAAAHRIAAANAQPGGSALEIAGDSPAAMIASLRARGRRPLLIVDQAQWLASVPAAILPVLLIGRADNEALPAWASVCTRGSTPSHVSLQPLAAEGIVHYIARRLTVAGARDPVLFSADAASTLFAPTRGIPRLINALCDASLNLACSRGLHQVGVAEIVGALQTTHWQSALTGERPPPPAISLDRAAAAITADYAAPPSNAASLEQLPQRLARPRAAHVRLTVMRGDETLQQLTLDAGSLTIGRAADNNIVLASDFVSRTHCALITTPTGDELRTTAIDLRSLNGMLVNGARATRQRLVNGDKLRIGDFVLHYVECADAATDTSPQH